MALMAASMSLYLPTMRFISTRNASLRFAFTTQIITAIVAATIGTSVLAEAKPLEVKIVSSLPRTGSANTQSSSIVNGIRLAIAQADSQRIKIAYEDWDDASPERGAWDPVLEAANADKAIRDPAIVALIGPYNSGAAKISMPKTNAAGLLQVSPSVTWPGLTKPGIGEANEPAVYRPSGKRNFFRVVPADDIQGKVGAEWARELGVKRAYVLHDRELYGKGVAEIFRRSAPENGIEILAFDGIDPKASNYRSLATKIRQLRPDLVYFGGTTQTNAGQLAKDLKASGVTAKFMVPDGCFEQAFIQAAGAENLNGRTFITFGGVPPEQLTGAGKRFFDEYQARFKTPPESYSVYGYEAARVIIEGILRAGSTDRAAIIEAVSTMQDFSGALGTWSFDENGDTTLTTMSGNVVENGAFKFSRLLGAKR
jgi:branched-chain amino acid transport system substrate-binding protein